MLRLPPFEYLAPESLTEAVALKKSHGDDAMYVAGGTDLYPKMKRRQMEPRHLIALNRIQELRCFANGDGMTIGAGTSLADIAAHPQILDSYPALAKAASLVSSPPLRNAGTIGGNLCVDTRCTYYDQSFEWRKALGFCMKKDGDICWVATSSPKCLAVSSSDIAPVAIAMGAELQLVGPDGERRLPAEQLYNNDGQFYLHKQPGEILVSIHLPPMAGWRTAYWKLRRRGSIDFPILSVAVSLLLSEDGLCEEVRVVLGAVASKPLLLDAGLTGMLRGQRLTADLVERFAGKAYRPAKPVDNADMGLSYRKKMSRLYLAGAIKEAAGLAQE